ncbi:MAG: hypothetical protein ACOCY1_06185 [Halovenus sp.]
MRDEDGSDIERYHGSEYDRDRSGDRSAAETSLTPGERESPARSRSRDPGTGRSGAATVADLADAGRSVTVDSESITATLIGVPRVDIHEFVYDHQLGLGHDPEETRSIAMFDLENTGRYPLNWRPTRTRFIGTDDYTYQPSRLSVDPSRLGPGCHTRQVEVEPERRARVVTLVEQLPPGVEVAEVVRKVTIFGDSQRLSCPVE